MNPPLEIPDYPAPRCGMGVSFNWTIWQILRHHSQRLWVNWNKPDNPYRDNARGDNVFDFYFTQPSPTGPITPAPLEDPLDLPLSGHMAWDLAHQRAIQPFAAERIRLLPEIQAEVDAFRAEHFRGRVLGIHLRATDKNQEYEPMTADETVREVEALLERLQPSTVFLQTDDIRQWTLMQRFHPVSLEIPRTKRSLHHHPPSGPYQSGRWAVVDGWLGAACDWYAYTPSNFATISLCMGQHREIHRLNRHCRIYPFPARVDALLGL